MPAPGPFGSAVRRPTTSVLRARRRRAHPRGQPQEDVLEPLAAGPKVAQLKIMLGKPPGQRGHESRNGRCRDQVLARRTFGDRCAEPHGELAQGEPRFGSETELCGLTLDLSLAPRGDDLAVVDDDHPVGQAFYFVEFVAGEDHAHAV